MLSLDLGSMADTKTSTKYATCSDTAVAATRITMLPMLAPETNDQTPTISIAANMVSMKTGNLILAGSHFVEKMARIHLRFRLKLTKLMNCAAALCQRVSKNSAPLFRNSHRNPKGMFTVLRGQRHPGQAETRSNLRK